MAYARTKSDGGGYNSYVDCGLVSGRYMDVTKIKLVGYVPGGWLEIDPDSYNFGYVKIDEHKDHTFKVKNTGDRTVYNIESKISWGADFSVIQGATKDYLAPDESYNVKVRFQPSAEGDREGVLGSQGDDSNFARSDLSGTGEKKSGCPEGTQITMASGFPITKPIEDIEVAEFILSYDPILQVRTIAEVIEVYVYTEGLPDHNLIFNGNLEVTPNHNLYINGTEWMEAENAQIDYYMLGNTPGIPETSPIVIFSIVDSFGVGGPIYDLVIQPLAGEACGYWADGILVGGYN